VLDNCWITRLGFVLVEAYIEIAVGVETAADAVGGHAFEGGVC
jgi:uncharacterized Fe-S cluster-containing MiaB family protein